MLPLPVATLAGLAKRICAWEPTTVMTVLQACKTVCVSGKDGLAAASEGMASHPSSKLRCFLLTSHAVPLCAGQPGDPRVHHALRSFASCATGRSAFLRLLCHNHDHGIPWDGEFGKISEVDL